MTTYKYSVTIQDNEMATVITETVVDVKNDDIAGNKALCEYLVDIGVIEQGESFNAKDSEWKVLSAVCISMSQNLISFDELTQSIRNNINNIDCNDMFRSLLLEIYNDVSYQISDGVWCIDGVRFYEHEVVNKVMNEISHWDDAKDLEDLNNKFFEQKVKYVEDSIFELIINSKIA